MDFTDVIVRTLFKTGDLSRCGFIRRTFIALFKDGSSTFLPLISLDGNEGVITFNDDVVEFHHPSGKKVFVPYADCKEAVLAFCNDL